MQYGCALLEYCNIFEAAIIILAAPIRQVFFRCSCCSARLIEALILRTELIQAGSINGPISLGGSVEENLGLQNQSAASVNVPESNKNQSYTPTAWIYKSIL